MEEQIIDGKLAYAENTTQQFKFYTQEELTMKILSLKTENVKLRNKLRNQEHTHKEEEV